MRRAVTRRQESLGFRVDGGLRKPVYSGPARPRQTLCGDPVHSAERNHRHGCVRCHQAKAQRPQRARSGVGTGRECRGKHHGISLAAPRRAEFCHSVSGCDTQQGALSRSLAWRTIRTLCPHGAGCRRIASPDRHMPELPRDPCQPTPPAGALFARQMVMAKDES